MITLLHQSAIVANSALNSALFKWETLLGRAEQLEQQLGGTGSTPGVGSLRAFWDVGGWVA